MKSVGQQQKTASTAPKCKVNKGTSVKPRQTNPKTVRQKGQTPGKNNVHSVEETKLNEVNTNSLTPNPSLPPWMSNLGTSLLSFATETPTMKEGQSAMAVAKLKLQLFPIDDVTLKGLQKDEHNPHLELTLRARKKISSVLKHVSTKWANSKIAVGELMLFPYEAQLENLDTYRRWSAGDTGVNAGDVYVDVGSPAVFRLRYGWFSSVEPRDGKGKQCLYTSHQQEFVSTHDSLKSCSGQCLPKGAGKELANVEKQNGTGILFPDNLTNTSFRDLLAASSITSTSRHNRLPRESSSHLSQIPFSCDSFDAAIASHVARHQTPNQSVQVANTSIWDAEETCHAFSFQKKSSSAKEFIVPTQCGNGSCNNENFSEKSPDLAKLHNQVESIDKKNNLVESTKYDISKEPGTDLQPHEQDSSSYCHGPQPQAQVQSNNENSLGFAGINWDSLAPLESGVPFKQINCDDSINFSAVLGNSRDASRSCCFALWTR